VLIGKPIIWLLALRWVWDVHRPLPRHWWENDGLIEPKMIFLLCGEQYCVKLEGQLSGLEKYKCVRLV
jgi:hypothetical protein